MTETDIEESKAPLVEHLTELRNRLIKILIAIAIAFVFCFYFAENIFEIMIQPYKQAAGPEREIKFVFLALQGAFFAKLKIGLFGAVFCAFPIIATQLYMFMAPGLYSHERNAFYPFLIAMPVLFIMGVALVYFGVMPVAAAFFLAQETTLGDVKIENLPGVSEYLSLFMAFILAFGLVFQLPVALTLLARVGIVSADSLASKRKYAVVIAFFAAMILTPPDPISQISLALPTLLLYELSIITARFVERQREKRIAEYEAEEV